MISHYGWRKSFWVAGGATGALALLWRWYVTDYPDVHLSNTEYVASSNNSAVRTNVPWRRLLTDRNLALLTLGYSTLGYFEYMFFYWIYYYFGNVRHMEHSETTICTTFLFLTFTLMTPIGGWCSDYISRVSG